MKKNLTITFFENGYKMIASQEDDGQYFNEKKLEAQNETNSSEWQLVFDPAENNTDWAVWNNGNYRIISDCGVSSLYKKIENNEPAVRNLKVQA